MLKKACNNAKDSAGGYANCRRVKIRVSSFHHTGMIAWVILSALFRSYWFRNVVHEVLPCLFSLCRVCPHCGRCSGLFRRALCLPYSSFYVPSARGVFVSALKEPNRVRLNQEGGGGVFAFLPKDGPPPGTI